VPNALLTPDEALALYLSQQLLTTMVAPELIAAALEATGRPGAATAVAHHRFGIGQFRIHRVPPSFPPELL